jgi:large subunit ribosomal protein L22
MASYKYATTIDEKRQAKTVALSQPVSTKQSLEIATWLRGKNTAAAKRLLEGVLAMQLAVPYKRFNKKVAHKSGMAAGRYPQKAAKLFLKLVKEVEANANVKGFDQDSLRIAAIVVHRSAKNIHYGRQRGRAFKNSHIEIVVEESVAPKKAPKKETAKKDVPKKDTPKVEDKKPAVKESPKVEEKAEEVKTPVKEEVKTEAKPKAEEAPVAEVKPKEKLESKPTQEKKEKSDAQ